jgi:hypothetical protein
LDSRRDGTPRQTGRDHDGSWQLMLVLVYSLGDAV